MVHTKPIPQGCKLGNPCKQSLYLGNVDIFLGDNYSTQNLVVHMHM